MVSEPEAAAIYTARYLKENAKKELLRVSLVVFQLSLRRDSFPIRFLGCFEELELKWMGVLARGLHVMLAAPAKVAGCLKNLMRCSGHALSVFLARDSRRQSVPLSNGFADLLQPGECFVLCDAGGGTVVSFSRSHGFPSSNCLPSHQDVVSYKVTQLEPILELEEMTISTSLHHRSHSKISTEAN
jgi:hypothetical protein